MCDSSEHKKAEAQHGGGAAEEGDGSLEEASTSRFLQRRDVKPEAAGKARWWLPGSTGYGAPGSTLPLPTSSVFTSHVSLLPCKPLPVGRTSVQCPALLYNTLHYKGCSENNQDCFLTLGLLNFVFSPV